MSLRIICIYTYKQSSLLNAWFGAIHAIILLLIPLTSGYDLYSSTMYHTSFKLWIILLKFCIIFLATTKNKSIIIIIIIIIISYTLK